MGRKPAKAKSRTKRPVARESRKTDDSRVRDLETRLAESLNQQIATAEILRVIASSPGDVQPVFDAIVASASRLCDAPMGGAFRYDGELVHFVAVVGPEASDIVRRMYPLRPSRASITARAVLDRRLVHVHDATRDPEPEARALAGGLRYRSIASVPMLRHREPVGAITLARREARPFSDAQLALLQTFADQAVIAIENARLFNELQARNRDLTEALEQQTATSDILRVISSSPTDVQPVFDTIVSRVVRLCDAYFSTVWRYDGTLIHHAADNYPTTEMRDILTRGYPAPARRGSAVAQAIDAGQVVHVEDLLDGSAPAISREVATALGYRTLLCVPMLCDGVSIGAIAVARREQRPFADRQIELVQTFARQAVIAIENVRLFNETRASLERQTVTAEILRVIASSPTNLQTVLDTMAESAARVCDARDTLILLREDERLALRAHFGTIGAAEAVPVVRGSPSGRAILDRQPIHIEDLTASEEFPVGRQLALRDGFRTALAVPLLRPHDSLGVILVRRAEVKPFTNQQIALVETFADQAVIAIENARLFHELQARNAALTQSLDQQTATSEILRVISGAHTDAQPVFDTIVRNAVKLCTASFGGVQRIVDGRMTLDAQCGLTTDELAVLQRDVFPLPISRETATGRAVVDRSVVHFRDIREDPEFGLHILQTMEGFRTVLAVPMLRDGVPIGALALWRREVLPFSDTEISLVQTFADQAVIAIENVRLFTELQQKNAALTRAHAQVSESLEQQTATSEILRVISQAPGDLQPVLTAVAQNAARLCDARDVAIVRLEGSSLRMVAGTGAFSEMLVPDDYNAQDIPVTRGSVTGRAITDRITIHVHDLAEQSETEYPHGRALQRRYGHRTMLATPLLREGLAIGAISICRFEVRAFSESQIALLKTFADQAVIAIENVRLFTELETKNRDLTTALDQQTATSEILRVISSSQMDVQPVFEAIARNAQRLLGSHSVAVWRADGDVQHLVAFTSTTDAGDAALRALDRSSVDRFTGLALAYREQRPFVVSDMETDSRIEDEVRVMARARGFRSMLVTPMVREAAAIGSISLTRAESGPFNESEIAMLQTFADQAVIAIENARLLGELQARTTALTRSVDELTALGDVGRALSSTLDLETVLQTIVTRANELAGTDGCSIYEYDEADEVFRLRASNYADPREADTLDPIGRATPIPKGQGAASRAAALRQPIQFPDIAVEGAYESPIRGPLLQSGYRAILTVPLLLEEQVIGALSISRKTPGEFAPEIVRLLTTFSGQSALAIQNARLFRELADKSRQLELASQHKSEFLANMSHELRTPLNAIIGFSEVLAERMFGELNAKQDEYLRDIYASGQHLLSLINDILDLSKIEAGRMELEVSDFDLPAAIDNALTLVRERASRHGIALHHEIDPDLGRIQGDERKLKQVLLNLLSNAIKFTPEGGRIDVRARLVDGMVEVAVTDTGVGIAPEDQVAVFEEFRQVGTADKKVEGTGLGLTLSRKFVELHGGMIWVESAPGRGSTFTFTLPGR